MGIWDLKASIIQFQDTMKKDPQRTPLNNRNSAHNDEYWLIEEI